MMDAGCVFCFCEDGLDKKEICQMTIETGHLLMISTEFRCQEVNLKGGERKIFETTSHPAPCAPIAAL